MLLTVTYDIAPKHTSARAAAVMGAFGVGFEAGRRVIAEGLELPIEAGDVVCFTGESGSGKSSLMRAAARQLEGVANVDEIVLDDRPVIDLFTQRVGESLQLLAACGLAEAPLMLRTPAELSDGQRYRLRLALALARSPRWVVSDEFSATLDRTLAKVVAANVRRTADRTGTGFLLATTHEDVVEDLRPSLHVRCALDGRIEWKRADDPLEKKDSALRGTYGSASAPNATGRISLGGITEVITSAA